MKVEICTRFQQCVRIWVASCAGTPAKKPGTVRVTARALMHWAVSLTARLFLIWNAPTLPVPSTRLVIPSGVEESLDGFPSMNRLYFGDNLMWLSDRKEFPDASVDLVYLDPPFNSNADYNVLFREPSGQVSQAQFHAFTDTWSWADAADTYHQFIDNCSNVAVVELMEALQSFLKHSPMMAYLAMMAPRLLEMRRVLKETGSLYLHCDPTADHYLRMLLDGVFGARFFRNDIVWKRRVGSFSTVHTSRQFGDCYDDLLFYTKSD